MEELIKKYKEKLDSFEKMKPNLEIQMTENVDALAMGNMYYMLLLEIDSDLQKM